MHVPAAKAPRRGGGAGNRIVKRACDEISSRTPKPMRRNHTAGGPKATGKMQLHFLFDIEREYVYTWLKRIILQNFSEYKRNYSISNDSGK